MRYILNDKGYTFAVAIIQLSVLLLFAHLLAIYFIWFKQTGQQFFQSEKIEWEMFSLDLENTFSSVETTNAQNIDNGIRYNTGESENDIECYSSLIRKQKNRTGHEPLLTGLILCKLKIVNDQVHVQVEFENGKKEERTYEILGST
jgi:competence protein ComGF